MEFQSENDLSESEEDKNTSRHMNNSKQPGSFKIGKLKARLN